MDEPKRTRRTKTVIVQAIRQAVDEEVKRRGFALTLLGDIIKTAGIEPAVFYNRYKNLDAYYEEFVKEYDYWFTDVVGKEVAEGEPTKTRYMNMVDRLVKELADDSILTELLRWEVAEDCPTTKRMTLFREMQVMQMMINYKKLFKGKDVDIAAFSAIVIGGIYYLCMHKDRSPFCGIDINDEMGLAAIRKALKALVDYAFADRVAPEEKARREIAKKMRENGIDDDTIERCTGLRL